jgi:hypothetical protein
MLLRMLRFSRRTLQPGTLRTGAVNPPIAPCNGEALVLNARQEDRLQVEQSEPVIVTAGCVRGGWRCESRFDHHKVEAPASPLHR